MRCVFLFLTLTVALASARYVISDERHKADFAHFVRTFNRTYESNEHRLHRFTTFKTMNQKVQDHNARYANGEVTWDMQIDQFSDWTPAEFKQFFSGYSEPNGTSHPSLRMAKRAPATIDWTKRGAVGPVKNQGHCGSCWAFAATGALEGCRMLAGKGYNSLSEQQLQDCMFSRVCSPGGGGPDRAIDWVHTHGGISSGRAYPWTQSNGNCHNADIGGTAGGRNSAFGYNDIVNLVARAPAAIGIKGDTALQGYRSGVLNAPNCGTGTNHAVLAVGYATNCQGTGLDCWIIRNNWGTNWGTGGYALVAKGKNMCGIEHDAHIAVNC